MLQNLMGYPVATTGLVTAPSGLGTMIAMMLAGRLLRRVDARLLLLAGFLISAFALWQMMGTPSCCRCRISSYRASSRASAWGSCSCRCRR
jgi:predicted MFS family arabinose efflux permease